jgi:hypothetical protein
VDICCFSVPQERDVEGIMKIPPLSCIRFIVSLIVP